MPLVSNRSAVKEVYREAAERGIALPVFCAEDRETLEAILASALRMGEQIGVADLPIIPAWTSRYPARGQMTLVTACADVILGHQLMFADLRAFMGETSPYRRLRVLPHLDHGIPWLDGDVLDSYVADFASVMFDASERPFEENVKLTAEYVEKTQGQVVVEGAVDEIYEAGGGLKNQPTTVAQARRFQRETGVDIIVPNVGTEHRATGSKARYLGERAREISRAVGRVLCLHGTSSLEPEELPALPQDGFIKINIYTTLAVRGGQAVAREVLDNLGNTFDQQQLGDLIQRGVLGPEVLAEGYGQTLAPIGPKLARVANPPRRDAWFAAVRDRCYEFLEVFHYRGFAG